MRSFEAQVSEVNISPLSVQIEWRYVDFGKDGLIIESKSNNGLLLPQVFKEYGCTEEAALEIAQSSTNNNIKTSFCYVAKYAYTNPEITEKLSKFEVTHLETKEKLSSDVREGETVLYQDFLRLYRTMVANGSA